MTVRGIALSFAALGASAGVAESHVTTIEAMKNTTIVLGLVWTVGKFGHLVIKETLNWGDRRVKAAVRSEMNDRFSMLPCVQEKECSTGEHGVVELEGG